MGCDTIKMEGVRSSKMLVTPATVHGITMQKTTSGIFTAARISNLTYKRIYINRHELTALRASSDPTQASVISL
jgi:hypothetical protein